MAVLKFNCIGPVSILIGIIKLKPGCNIMTVNSNEIWDHWEHYCHNFRCNEEVTVAVEVVKRVIKKVALVELLVVVVVEVLRVVSSM